MEPTQQQPPQFTRDEAYKILTKYLKNPNLLKHSLAAEAAMKALYNRINTQEYNKDEEEKWGITGLLHDADYELCKGKPEQHGLLLFEKEKNTIPGDIAYAIMAHNWAYTKQEPKSAMDWAIATCDQLTGLIIAATLVHPDKKLLSVYPEFILNRYKSSGFAAGANRESIAMCEEKLGIPIMEFIQIVLKAMQDIHEQLGL